MNRRILSSAVLLSSAVALASCMGQSEPEAEVIVETPPVIAQDVVVQAMPSGEEIAHPTHGSEESFAYGAIAGAGEAPANGVATLQVFENNASVLQLNLNIHQAPAGSMYVAWLKNDDGRTVNVGRLETPLSDVRHSVTFEANDDLSGFFSILVTLETTDNPSAPGETVAQGMMKVTER